MSDESFHSEGWQNSQGDEELALGRRVNLGDANGRVSVISRADALEKVAGSFRDDPCFAEQVVRILGWENLCAARPRVIPSRMPLRGIRALECSISYSPPRSKVDNSATKPRRPRPERDALPYYTTIQIFDAKSRGFADPAWRGAAQLRTPQRARIDARKKDKLTSLSPAYAQWIEDEVCHVAEQNGMFVGFLMDRQKGQGTYFHEHQVILIGQEEVENRKVESAFILSLEEGCPRCVYLPSFDTRSSNGPLGGNFILQSRGVSDANSYAGWPTGILDFK